MNLQNTKSPKSLRDMLDKPDFRNVKSVYLKIKVSAFIEYFKRLTIREEYYDAVFSKLVEISAEIFDNSTEANIRKNLTMCGLFFAAEQHLRLSPDNAFKALYILEKALFEPIAVFGSIPSNPESVKASEIPFDNLF